MTTTTTRPAPGAAAGTGDGLTHRQILQVLVGLLAALFTALVSTTIVGNALPTIVGDLGGSQTGYTWVITAALLANTVTTPIWGKLSDLFSKKLLVQLSIVVFVVGSIGAGLSRSVGFLIACRVVQGVGMGGLTALVQSIIGTIIPPRQRGRYAGYMGGTMALAMSGGPLIGGVIVDGLDWRWCFYVCVPLALVSLVVLQRTLSLPASAPRKVSIDWLGSLLIAAGVSLLLVWVSFAGKADFYAWGSWQTAVMLAGGIVLLALAVLVESRVAEPVIPLDVLRDRTTALSIVASLAVGISLFGGAVFLAQYFQVARGYSPTEAGLLSLPNVAGSLIFSTLSGRLITSTGRWKRFLVAGAVLLAGGLGLLGTIDHQTSLVLVGLYTFVMGAGTGMLMQNLVLAVQNTVPLRDIGAASSSVAFFRTLGGTIGVSVLGAVLSSRVTDLSERNLAGLGVPAGDQVGGGSTGSLDLAALPDAVAGAVRSAYGDGIATVFLVAAAVALVTLVAVLAVRETPLRLTVDVAPDQHDQHDAARPAASGPGVARPELVGAAPEDDATR